MNIMRNLISKKDLIKKAKKEEQKISEVPFIEESTKELILLTVLIKKKTGTYGKLLSDFDSSESIERIYACLEPNIVEAPDSELAIFILTSEKSSGEYGRLMSSLDKEENVHITDSFTLPMSELTRMESLLKKEFDRLGRKELFKINGAIIKLEHSKK